LIAAGNHALKIDFLGTAGVKPVSASSGPADRPSPGNLPSSPARPAAPLSRIEYPDLWPGVSLAYETTPAGIVKSTYTVAPGADPKVVSLKANVPVQEDSEGRLSYRFETGELIETKPVAWQEVNGRRIEVDAAFRLDADQEFGFQVEKYNPGYPLVIDPVLTWHTFFGRAESTVDEARAVAYDGSSAIIVCGTSDGPWGSSPVDSYNGGTSDAYVAKFNSSGSRLWNTFLGGTAADWGTGIAVDTSGYITVCGSSEAAWGSPTRRAFSSNRDVFVAQLNSSGSLLWNTFLGGSAYDEASGIVIDGSGNSYVTGGSEATWGSPVQAISSGRDAFAAKLSSSGYLQWNTFLGGTSTDMGNDIAYSTASSGLVFVVGDSQGTWGASPVRAYSASKDGFVAQLSASTGARSWNTFLGGSDSDSAQGVAATSTGIVYVAGTSSASWVCGGGGVTVRPFSTGPDAYAAVILSGAVTYNTFLGGSGSDSGADLVLDGGGNAYVTGTSGASWGTPVQAFQGQTDAFWVKLNANLSIQGNPSFLGSAGYDESRGIVPLSSGSCAIAGKTDTGPWPAAGSPVSAYAGDEDGFLEIVSSTGSCTAYTFLGGLGYDAANAVDIDASGNVYVAGTSRKTWGTPVRSFSGTLSDVFVAKLNSSGVLQWNTFLGGTADDQAAGIAVTSGGLVHVTGWSKASWGSPVRAYGGGTQDVFAAKLYATGGLQWNTFLGGSAADDGKGIAIDGSGNVYVAGTSPATWGSPVRRSFTGSNDAFAVELNSSGALQWVSFLGGSGSEVGSAVAVDGSGNVFVAGTATASWGSPLRGYTSSTSDGFAAKLDSDGYLQWNTFLGGGNADSADGIAVFAADTVYVVGQSRSTWGSPLNPHPGYWNGFAAKLNGGGGLAWNTFFGTITADVKPLSADSDSFGNLYVGGLSSATWATPFRAYSGNDDLFAAMFDSSGNPVWNGFFGSVTAELFGGLAAGAGGDVVAAGASSQTWGSPLAARAYGGGTDAFALFITNELPPTITVTSPNGGETWGQGTVQSITWNPTGVLPNVKIDYSTNGGSQWNSITASTPNSGSYAWTLPVLVSTNCLVRVGASGGGSPVDQSDAVFTITDQVPTIALSQTSFQFGAEQNGTPTPGQTTILTNSGNGTLTWTATPQNDWIGVAPAGGTGDAVLTITISRTDLSAGSYTGTVLLAAGGASNTPQTITVNLNITAAGSDAPPFGSFDLPAEGLTVRSSIPVTGWALDDVHVASVKLYRGTSLADRVYIDEATFVEGARLDVEAAYSSYPESKRAGWGYMMLTNFLPLGDGPYNILVYATDSKGQETLLGSKAIVVDNAAAVLPFGAIDTPAQGGTASGSGFYNFGWALTPLPDNIPIDGSTILVWVDSLPLDHPDYNHYRGDIATLFPGYANSNGAVGFYVLNTEAMTNGVHEIAWSVSDSGGDVDGIGSRYFTVTNLSGAPSPGATIDKSITGKGWASIPADPRTPIFIKRGLGESEPIEALAPDAEGVIRIEVPLLSRIALYPDAAAAGETRERLLQKSRKLLLKSGEERSEARFAACQIVGGEARPLPVGSSFDRDEGVIYWQPGPGFAGEYEIVIVRNPGPGAARTILKIKVI